MKSSLLFIERFDRYSLYRRHDGTDVFIGHGTPRTYLIEFELDAVAQLWNDYEGTDAKWHWRTREQFVEHLRTLLVQPMDADGVIWCTRCEDVTDREDAFSVAGGDYACHGCFNDYYCTCDDCDESVTEAICINDRTVCDSCRDRNYSYCDHCDEYHHDSDSGDHRHDEDEGNGCCESPEFSFVVRNDGDPLLANDTRVTVSLPAGTIDHEGVHRIQVHLRQATGMYSAAATAADLDARWQTKEGTFTKRLSRAVWKQHSQKIDPAVLSEIGNIARAHSTSVDFAIETTRDLNQSAEDFYHEDSCWWQSYFHGRCALKTNGGFGLRTFGTGTYGDVSGRAWVMPLKQTDHGTLEPTFETLAPNAFVVFNGYGALEGYNAARIVSHMAGWTYRKITFTCSPMFVNGNVGYLIAPEDIATGYTDGSLSLNVEQHASLYDAEKMKELVNV